MKRMASPSYWPIHRKENKFVAKPIPGSHTIAESMPILLALREALKYANTKKEAKIILSEKKVKVDGKIVADEKSSIGLMDVIEVPDLSVAFRILSHPKKGLILHQITTDEAMFKLCKIDNKSAVRKGHVQLNLHDGRNLVITVKDVKKPDEDVYKTSDVLKISIPKQEMLGHLRFEEGVFALVTGGKNVGSYGKVIAIEKKKGPFPTFITLESAGGKRLQTTSGYVFAIGREAPWISVSEVET